LSYSFPEKAGLEFYYDFANRFLL